LATVPFHLQTEANKNIYIKTGLIFKTREWASNKKKKTLNKENPNILALHLEVLINGEKNNENKIN